jgi:5-methylcytosine-specific restriction endonuclease McrA/endogenous inhibitor of DNA gyrase (YacG/DUF329 family)
MSERTCPGCGTALEIGQRERNPKRWCSQKCRQWALRHPGKVRPTFKACANCGVNIADMANRTVFCSSRCDEIARGQRLAEPLAERVCALPECDVAFVPYKGAQRCCSERHGKLLSNRESRADGRQKPEPWTEARKERWKRREAAKKAASSGRPVVREDIGNRDSWVCYLCEQPIDRSLAWPDPESATTDHVIPLSRGGEHDPDNVRITHARCNSAKGDRLPEDLLTR